jgi:hypothetical protein
VKPAVKRKTIVVYLLESKVLCNLIMFNGSLLDCEAPALLLYAKQMLMKHRLSTLLVRAFCLLKSCEKTLKTLTSQFRSIHT